MAGGFPKVPALRAACFARCCTAPLCSLIYHCVHLLATHLLSLPSLSLFLPRRSQPCCHALQFYVGQMPALVVCFSSLRDSRICTDLNFVVSSARRLSSMVNGLCHGYNGTVYGVATRCWGGNEHVLEVRSLRTLVQKSSVCDF
jgi:hypothetical protein